MTPRYVVGSATDATVALRRLARVGWHTREGFALTESTWDVTGQKLVLYGRVTDLDTAKLAVHAAARGAGLVAIADPNGEVGQALLADLGRLGPVTRDPEAEVTADDDEPDGDSPLPPEQRPPPQRPATRETPA